MIEENMYVMNLNIFNYDINMFEKFVIVYWVVWFGDV